MANWFEQLMQAGGEEQIKHPVGTSARVTALEAAPSRVILLPPRGIRAGAAGARAFATRADSMSQLTAENFFRSLVTADTAATGVRVTPRWKLRVVDAVAENGAKLVEASPADIQALRIAQPGLRIVPERFYSPAVNFMSVRSQLTASAKTAGKVVITVLSGAGGPISDAMVVAFTDFAQLEGVQGPTDANGQVALSLPSNTAQL